MAGRIFISYSQKDPRPTQDVANLLTSEGYSVWWDTNLVPGEQFRKVIDQELNAADAVIVIWTDDSVVSYWVISEAEDGLRRGKLIPLRTRNLAARIPKPFDVIHTGLVDNRLAILAAVRRVAGEPQHRMAEPHAATRVSVPERQPARRASFLVVLLALSVLSAFLAAGALYVFLPSDRFGTHAPGERAAAPAPAQASQSVTVDSPERARVTAADDQQVAALDQARGDTDVQFAKPTEPAKSPTADAVNPDAPGGAQPPVPEAGRQADREPPGEQQAALSLEKPAGPDEGQLAFAIKTELNRLGCYSDPIGSNRQTPALRKAISDFATRTHLAKVPDGPTPQLLEDLKARSGRICAPDCGPREQESNGRCVAKTCGGNQVLDRNGNCVPRSEPKPAPHPRPPDLAAPRPGTARCFTFNNRQFCE